MTMLDLPEYSPSPSPEPADGKPPVVSIRATQWHASENNRTPAIFAISRTGDTTWPLDVYYRLRGKAVPGVDDDTGRIPADTDYTGAAEVPDETGGRFIRIDAGQKFVHFVLTPVSDTVREGPESIVVLLEPSPWDIGNPNPTYRVGAADAAGAILHDLVLDWDLWTPAGAQDLVRVRALVPDLNSPNPRVRRRAEDQLAAMLHSHPDLEPAYRAQEANNLNIPQINLAFEVMFRDEVRYREEALALPGITDAGPGSPDGVDIVIPNPGALPFPVDSVLVHAIPDPEFLGGCHAGGSVGVSPEPGATSVTANFTPEKTGETSVRFVVKWLGTDPARPMDGPQEMKRLERTVNVRIRES